MREFPPAGRKDASPRSGRVSAPRFAAGKNPRRPLSGFASRGMGARFASASMPRDPPDLRTAGFLPCEAKGACDAAAARGRCSLACRGKGPACGRGSPANGCLRHTTFWRSLTTSSSKTSLLRRGPPERRRSHVPVPSALLPARLLPLSAPRWPCPDDFPPDYGPSPYRGCSACSPPP